MKHRLLVAVDEFGRIERRLFAFEDVLRQLQQLRRDLHIRNVIEIVLGVADLIWIAQGCAHQPLVPRLKHDHALTLRKHDASERHHSLVAHRFADYRERFQTDWIIRSNVIRAIQITLVNLVARNEGVDLDHVVALHLDRLDLLVVNQEIRILRIFVSAALVRRLNRLARYIVYELLAQPIASLLVDLAERHPVARGRSRIKRDRARNEG